MHRTTLGGSITHAEFRSEGQVMIDDKNAEYDKALWQVVYKLNDLIALTVKDSPDERRLVSVRDSMGEFLVNDSHF
jgi:hypothetical protein